MPAFAEMAEDVNIYREFADGSVSAIRSDWERGSGSDDIVAGLSTDGNVTDTLNQMPKCFLLSSPRAGSTLLSRVLDSHSQISSPCEICLPYVVRTSWKLRKSIRNMRKICGYFGATIPSPMLRLVTRNAASRHFEELTGRILDRESKRILVVKDPRHAGHIGRIERLCSDNPPKYLLLHRDARAVCHSFVTTLGRKPERGLRAWFEAERGMRACAEAFPERCLEIWFEDLIANPHETISRVTEFLGCPFEPPMLQYGRHRHADDDLGLWTNPRLIQTVNRGVIQTSRELAWQDSQSVLDAFNANPEVQRLNRRSLDVGLRYGQAQVKVAAPSTCCV